MSVARVSPARFPRGLVFVTCLVASAVGCAEPNDEGVAGGGLTAGIEAGASAGAAAAGAGAAGVAAAGTAPSAGASAGTVAAGSGAAGTGTAGAASGAGAAGVGVAGDGAHAGMMPAGDGAAGMVTAGTGGTMMVDPSGNANRNPGFIDLSPAMGAALPMEGDTVTPAPPTGWTFHNIEGAVCRDGSPMGIYLRRGSVNQLLIYFEGGGACSNDHYCAFNPKSMDQVLAGDGQVVIGSALGAGPGRQQPGVYTDASHVGQPAGVFDHSRAENPFQNWNQVYIPYCTGDVHFGTNERGMVPSLPMAQKFVGYKNTLKIISRVVPTFRDSVDKVVVAGSSAGGFGASLNFSMIQDSFGDTPVLVVNDSGPPFDDEFMPPCMQTRWRETWGFNGSLPPDCTECQQADGAGLAKLADFLLRKHPVARISIISSMQDEVIRLFYSVGLANCMNYDTADPVVVVLAQFDPNVFFPGQQYTDGLNDLRSRYQDTGQLATYYMAGVNLTFHQHLFRPRFYEAAAGGKTIAQFVSDFLDGTVEQVGP